MIRSKKSTFVFYALMIITSLIVIFPILYAISVSFMTNQEILTGKLFTSRGITFDNYIGAFKSAPLLKYMLNSLVISTIVMIARLITCSMAAYAFVFLPFKGRNLIFMLFISTMIVPWEVTIIPNYMTIHSWGLLNNYAGFTLPFMASAFGMFLMRQHFMTIPTEFMEAAQMEGCGRIRYFTSFVIPLSTPVFITWAVYSFLTVWNMYLWPMLVSTTRDSLTIQIGLKRLVSQEAGTDWGRLMAGVVLVIIPSLVILFSGQKHIKRGITAGGVKG